MSNLILNDNVIGGSSNDSSDILYTPNDNRTETNVQDELDRINTNLSCSNADIEIPFTTTTTRQQILNEISSVINFNKVTPRSVLYMANSVYQCTYFNDSVACFAVSSCSGSNGLGFIAALQASSVPSSIKAWMFEGNTNGNTISNILNSQMNTTGTVKIYY